MKTLLISILFLLSFTATATQWVITKHDINRVYDGDTFYINLKGLPSVLGEDLPIRVKDMDTPELRSSCSDPAVKAKEKIYAAQARDYLITLFEKANIIKIHNVERDSFFRLLADVEVDVVDLKQYMIEKGYAHEAIDGKRQGWCTDPRVLAIP